MMRKKTPTLEPMPVEEIKDFWRNGGEGEWPWTLEQIRDFFTYEGNGENLRDFAYPTSEDGMRYTNLARKPNAGSIALTEAELAATECIMRIDANGNRWCDHEGYNERAVLNRSKTMQRIYRAGLLAIMNEYATCELSPKEIVDAFDYEGRDAFKAKGRKKKAPAKKAAAKKAVTKKAPAKKTARKKSASRKKK